jgi:TRAP-type mannitol/chloroaromatic compound transport system permease small subunit
MFTESYVRHEVSGDAGGLLRWPVKLLIPVGFFLLAAQGISEIVKRIAFLRGLLPDPAERRSDREAAARPVHQI